MIFTKFLKGILPGILLEDVRWRINHNYGSDFKCYEQLCSDKKGFQDVYKINQFFF